MAIKTDLSELSLNQYQELTGKSYRTIKKRLERLDPLRTDGKSVFYQPKEALPLIYSELTETHASADETGSGEGEGFGSGPPHVQLTKQRTRVEKLRADKLQLEIDQLKGNLFGAEKIKSDWEEMTGAFRAKMLGLPARVSLQLAQLKTPAEIENLLRRTINEALSELSQYDPKK